MASDSKVVNIDANWRITVPEDVFSAGEAITIINTDANTANVHIEEILDAENGNVTLIYASTNETGDMSCPKWYGPLVLCIASNKFLVSGI